MKLALAIVGKYINTIIKIIGFIVCLPIIIIGLAIAQTQLSDTDKEIIKSKLK